MKRKIMMGLLALLFVVPFALSAPEVSGERMSGIEQIIKDSVTSEGEKTREQIAQYKDIGINIRNDILEEFSQKFIILVIANIASIIFAMSLGFYLKHRIDKKKELINALKNGR